MFHMKNRIGTFWILEPEASGEKYVLGCNNDTIGEYNSLDEAVLSVVAHDTGYIEWDMAEKVKVPKSLEEWQQGEPEDWQKFYDF